MKRPASAVVPIPDRKSANDYPIAGGITEALRAKDLEIARLRAALAQIEGALTAAMERAAKEWKR